MWWPRGNPDSRDGQGACTGAWSNALGKVGWADLEPRAGLVPRDAGFPPIDKREGRWSDGNH